MPPGSHTAPEVGAARWRVILLLCGWLIATGAHWDVVQVTAWTKMWIENARTQSSTAALARTFSPEGMCEMCHAVQAAKHGQPENPAAPLLEKAPLVLPSVATIVIAAPELSGNVERRMSQHSGALRPQPPTPPPRIEANLA